MEFAVSITLIFGFIISVVCLSNLKEKKLENEGIVL